MQFLKANPKTTIAGCAALATAIGHVLMMYLNHSFDPNLVGADIGMVLAGFGLIAARDAGK